MSVPRNMLTQNSLRRMDVACLGSALTTSKPCLQGSGRGRVDTAGIGQMGSMRGPMFWDGGCVLVNVAGIQERRTLETCSV